MDQAIDLARWALGKAASVWLTPQVVGSAIAVVLALLVAVRLRFGPRAWTRPLRSPAVRTDAAYAVFYVGGFYAFVIAGPAYRLLSGLVERHAPQLQLHLLSHLPIYAQFFAASIIMDGVLYWTHRWMHRSPWLWAFHSVHHSQRELTALSNFRFHAGDVFVRGLAQFVPGLLLGVPAYVWLPSVWIQVALDCLAHSGLGWSYGPLGAVIVSPGFHRVHHSADPGHYNTNYGMTYSFWDRLFGTASARPEPPSRYGVPGLQVPESFTRQLAFPFLFIAGAVGSRDPREGEP